MKISKKILITLFISIFCSVLGYPVLDYNVHAENIKDEDIVYIGQNIEEDNNYVSSQIVKVTSDLREASIPSSFDLRDKLRDEKNITIRVENQENHGVCWAFASLGALRTHLALKGIDVDPAATASHTTVDLSEWHMNFLTSKIYSKNDNIDERLKRDYAQSGVSDDNRVIGGSFDNALLYYKNNDGPILEGELPYNTYVDIENESVKQSLDDKQPKVFVHNTRNFANLFKQRSEDGTIKVYNSPLVYDENGVFQPDTTREISETQLQKQRNIIKQHIMENGGIFADIRIADNFTAEYQQGVHVDSEDEKYSHYDDGTMPKNLVEGHAITIIGWDDNYNASKTKFHSKDANGNPVSPQSDGAYLALNSHGADNGDAGYFWISYDDFFIEGVMSGYISADTEKNINTIQFSNNNAYTAFKEVIATQDGEITLDDNSKSVSGIDLIFNSIKTLTMQDKNLTSADLKTITDNTPNVNRLYLSGNKIDDLEFAQNLSVAIYDFRNQTLNYNIASSENTFNYPDILLNARRENNPIYSESGFEFKNCTENENKTGIIFDENATVAKVTVLSGNAEGTEMTVTRSESSEPTIVGMNLQEPSKKEYNLGDELSLDGGKIILIYSDNHQEEVDITQDMVSGFDNTTAGVKTITVRYLNGYAEFDVTVKPTLESIQIDENNPPKEEYFVGEAIDRTIGKIKVTYNNGIGVNKTIIYIDFIDDDITFVGFNTTTTGTKKVTVKYGGKSTTYEITVSQQEEPPEPEPVELESISIKTNPNPKTYYKGDRFDITGLVLEGTNNNGSKFDITSGYDYSPKTLSIVGNQKITITYEGKETEYYVDVQKVVVIRMDVNLLKDTYYVGETIDLEQIQVTLTKNNGQTQNLTAADYIDENRKYDTVGQKTITLYSGDKSDPETVSATFYLNIIANPDEHGEDPDPSGEGDEKPDPSGGQGENPGDDTPSGGQGENPGDDKPSGGQEQKPSEQQDKPAKQNGNSNQQNDTTQKQTSKQDKIETKESPKKEVSNEKKTQSDKELSNTGYAGMGFAIIALIILAIIFYKKYKEIE